MHPGSDEDLLQFKDYSNTPSGTSPPQINVNSPTHSANASGGFGAGRARGDPLSELIYDMSNSAQVLSGSSGGGSGGGGVGDGSGGATSFDDTNAANNNAAKVSFLTIEYYQQFFNVDTYMVLERIVNSMIPKRASSNYLRSTIGANPDLYGPFWINVTLIFCIAISGNIASYLQSADDNYHWRYNFHLVSIAATCIFLYVNFVPATLWALFKYSLKPVEEGFETENSNYTPSLLSLMCIYGYSMAIYIPVSILWVIKIDLLQWLLVITAALLSGIVLITVLSPALRNSKFSLFLIIGILCAHFLLAAGFMLRFFHMPSNPTESTVSQQQQQQALTAAAHAALNQIKNAVDSTVAGNINNSNTAH